jgi:hypothetical protein
VPEETASSRAVFITGPHRKIADALTMPDIADIEFE